MNRIHKMLVFLFVAAFAASLNVAVVHAADIACMTDFEGKAYKDSDCDGFIDAEYASFLENLPIDNCPSVKNGNCLENPTNCNLDGSYDGKDASTLSATARQVGDQADWNKNDIGDACDDSDGDGVVDYKDNCKSVSNLDQDPGFCTDSDNDGFEDAIDNCSATYNNTQTDSDLDGIGDACDNCLLVYNPDQEDTDDDSRGDACPKQPAFTPTPSETAMPENVGFQFGPNKTQGGGCSVIGSSSGAMPSIMLFAGFLAILLFRRNKTTAS